MKGPKRIDISPTRLKAFKERHNQRCFTEEDYELIGTLMDTLEFVLKILDEKAATIKRLLRMMFGSPSEKARAIFKGLKGKRPKVSQSGKRSKKPKGHGRNGVLAYPGAERIQVRHPSLNHGDPCPDCRKGKVYKTKDPHVPIRFEGRAPIKATIYEIEKLRCNLCGEIFKADLPDEAGDKKYDETVGTTIALLRYGSGFPHHRIERFQESVGVPLPASTQWEIVKNASDCVVPAHTEMVRQASRGEIFHNDDTTMKILSLMGENDEKENDDEVSSKRTGLFTTGILSVIKDRKIALFFSGRKHCGENLSDILEQRPPSLARPIQMCDALSRNLPREFKTVLSNCLCHARRGFVDVVESYPTQCRYVINTLARIYRHDAVARRRNLSAEERLEYHKEKSGPLMNKLKEWLTSQFAEKKVEPNSSLGKAIIYMLKHWEPLTLFLRKKKAPLDNNLCEQVLKRAILHRKNSLFYQTENGAEVGDRFMSLIHTCSLSGENPFDYLTALQKHHADVAAHPDRWMPWNFQRRLASLKIE